MLFMTTAWIRTSFESVEKRTSELTGLVVVHNGFFVRKMLLETAPLRKQLEDEGVELLMSCSDEEVCLFPLFLV